MAVPVPEIVVFDASVELVTMTLAEQTYFESVSRPDVEFFELVLSARTASIWDDPAVADADVDGAGFVSCLLTPLSLSFTYGR